MPKYILTEEDIKAAIRKQKAFWSLPAKLEIQQDARGLNYVWLICKCGDAAWVRWSRVKLGQSKGCRSCRAGLRSHGKSSTYLYKAWHDLKKKKRPLVKEWADNFFAFEEWASEFAAPGWKLVRIDKRRAYGPDNCDFVPIRRKNAKPGDPAADQNLLPIGIPALPLGIAG